MTKDRQVALPDCKGNPENCEQWTQSKVYWTLNKHFQTEMSFSPLVRRKYQQWDSRTAFQVRSQNVDFLLFEWTFAVYPSNSDNQKGFRVLPAILLEGTCSTFQMNPCCVSRDPHNVFGWFHSVFLEFPERVSWGARKVQTKDLFFARRLKGRSTHNPQQVPISAVTWSHSI